MSSDLTETFERADALKRKQAQEDHDLIMGQMSGSKTGKIEPRDGISLEARKKLAVQKEKEEDRKRYLTTELLNNYLQKLEAEIQALEAGFRARDGEEWREKLALQTLSADDIPQQRAGESIEDYRERIELLLIEEMLNEDGSVKKRYQSDPDIEDYARWAQKQNNYNRAQGYVHRIENGEVIALNEVTDSELLVFADRLLVEGSGTQDRFKNADDLNDDAKFQDNRSASRHSFLASDL